MVRSDKHPAIPGKLDTTVILTLLAKSDTVWFNGHKEGYVYQEHLKFTADYIVKNYNKEAKK